MHHPVAMSRVSMQNKDDSGKTVDHVESVKKQGRVDRDSTSGHKLERSRTTVSGRDNRRQKPQNTRSGGGDVSDLVGSNVSQNRPIVNDRVGVESRESSRMQLADKDMNRVNGNAAHTMESEGHKVAGERSHRTRTSQDRKSKDSSIRAIKEPSLPKPSPPSQKYLEGQVATQPESPWGQRLTPRSQDSRESDWLNQVKRYGSQALCFIVLISNFNPLNAG